MKSNMIEKVAIKLVPTKLINNTNSNGKRYGEYSMPECKKTSIWQKIIGK